MLVIGGAGGVGSIAIQLAKLAGLTVIATASRPESADWCRKLGADHMINHQIDSGELSATANDNLSPINAENILEGHRRPETGKSIGKLTISG